MATSTPKPETTFLPPDMTPEDWDAYRYSLMPGQLKTLAKQDAILSGFAHYGSIYRVAPAADIHRNSVYEWIEKNLYRFKDRLELASHSFRERLQDLALAKVEDHPKLHDILHMALLNANWPEKYRRDAIVVNVDVAKDVLAEVRKLTAARLAEAVTVEPGPETAEERVTRMLGPGESQGDST